MKRLLTTLTELIALAIGALLAAPAAFAMVPPEPGAPTPHSTVVPQAGFDYVSWPTLVIVVFAVAVGAVLALGIERIAHRSHALGVSAA